MASHSQKINILRLYTDDATESHFMEETLEAHEVNFAPPARPVYSTQPIATGQSMFLLLPDGYFGDFHPVPSRQIMTLVSGALEVTVSDGEVRHFVPGQTVLVEDTTGKGHSTRSIGGESVLTVVQL